MIRSLKLPMPPKAPCRCSTPEKSSFSMRLLLD
jgi:hypothetical protein